MCVCVCVVGGITGNETVITEIIMDSSCPAVVDWSMTVIRRHWIPPPVYLSFN